MNIKVIAAACALGVTSMANAAFIDLTSWEADGPGNWTTQGVNNDSVLQSLNDDPTVFFESGSMARGTVISGEITVQTTGDDDYIGFVLGYEDNELQSGTADYWLVDWKQGNQTFSGRTAFAGLSISHVTGPGGTLDFWDHGTGVDEKVRGTNLGSTGWQDNTTYSFDIVHTASLIQVSVNDILEISLTAADAGVSEFTDGAFGFYNYSQSTVLYAGIEESIAPPPNNIPEPSSLMIFSFAILGLISRKLAKQGS